MRERESERERVSERGQDNRAREIERKRVPKRARDMK